MNRNGAAQVNGTKVPNLFDYHDYRSFLKDWITFAKKNTKLSLRKLADQAEISPSFLSMIVSGSRALASESLGKLASVLGFNESEKTYFSLLATIADSESQEERMAALEKIQKFGSYKNLNLKEIEAFRYLTNWYYVAIREMAALPDFKLNPQWIKSKLKYDVPLKEITKAIKFLTDFNFIRVAENGTVSLSEKQVDCFGGVYKIVLTQFHKEMFTLASESIDKTPRRDRSLTFHTMAISQEHFGAVKKILDEALEKITKLGAKEENPDVVYHVSLATFPLTDSKKKEEGLHEDS